LADTFQLKFGECAVKQRVLVRSASRVLEIDCDELPAAQIIFGTFLTRQVLFVVKQFISSMLVVLLSTQAFSAAASIGCLHADKDVGAYASVQMHGNEIAHRAHVSCPDIAVSDAAVTGETPNTQTQCAEHCAHCHLAAIGLLVSDSNLAAPPLAVKTFAPYRAQLLSTEVDVPEHVPLFDLFLVAR